MRLNTKPMRVLNALKRVPSLAAETVDCVQVFRDAGTYEMPELAFFHAEDAVPAHTKGIATSRSWNYDTMYMVKLHDAIVLEDRTIITHDGRFLYDLWSHAGLHVKHPLMAAAAPGEDVTFEFGDPEYVAESSAFLFFSPASGQNHSHWLIQTCPQLGYLEQAGIRAERLVVMPSIREYQRETLKLLGYNSDRILVRPRGKPMRFRELYVGYVDGVVVPDFTFHDRMVEAVNPAPTGPELVYVARTDARNPRRFLNELDLIERLRRIGFTIVVPSELSARQEVDVFRHARCVVGPMGAGLYNLAFTKPGALVVGLSDPHYVMYWLTQTAALRGHRCGLILGSAFYSEDKIFHGSHNNWVLDPEQTVRYIADALNAVP